MAKREMTVTEFARLGGLARAAKLGKAGVKAAAKKMRDARWKKYRTTKGTAA